MPFCGTTSFQPNVQSIDRAVYWTAISAAFFPSDSHSRRRLTCSSLILQGERASFDYESPLSTDVPFRIFHLQVILRVNWSNASHSVPLECSVPFIRSSKTGIKRIPTVEILTAAKQTSALHSIREHCLDIEDVERPRRVLS